MTNSATTSTQNRNPGSAPGATSDTATTSSPSRDSRQRLPHSTRRLLSLGICVLPTFVAACSDEDDSKAASQEQAGDGDGDRPGDGDGDGGHPSGGGAPGDGDKQTMRVIFDHDGAFEDYYALTMLARASKLDDPPVELIGVTTNAVGESFCSGSNGYPELKTDLLGDFTASEGTIDGISQKILTLAGYEAPIFSGCGESTATITVQNEYSTGDFVAGEGPEEEYQIELPLLGLAGAGPCLMHQELSFLGPDLVCWAEFNRAFRDETLKFVLTEAEDAMEAFSLEEKSLRESKPASVFLAESMCEAHTTQKPLTIVAVGPATNVGRAIERLEDDPSEYGCETGTTPADLDEYVDLRQMGGAWDGDTDDDFDGDGNYKLNEVSPTWTAGNIYFQGGAHTFGMHHLPANTPDFDGVQTNHHKDVFNSLNNAEFNIWVDPYAFSKALESGISVDIVPLNVTDHATMAGFAQRIEDLADECNSPSAQFMMNLQRANMPAEDFYVFDGLWFWDTLTSVSLFAPGFLNMENTPDLEVTYSDLDTMTNGDDSTLTPALSDEKELFRRDQGRFFRKDRVDHPVRMSLSVIDEEDFGERFQDYLLDLVCAAD